MSSPLLRKKLRRDLRHKHRQVFAVAATVFIGVGLFVVSWDMYNNLQASYDLTYDKTNFADAWVHGDRDLADSLATIDGVIDVETRTSADIAMTIAGRPINGRIQGLPATGQPRINQLIVQHGEYLDPARPDSVIVEAHTAENFDLVVGDSIQLVRDGNRFDAPVIGIASSPEWLWLAPSSQEFLTDPNEFGVIFAAEELATALAPPASLQAVVRVVDHDPDVAEAVARTGFGLGATEAFDRAHHPSDQALQADVKGFQQMAVLFPMLFLGVAALATSVLLGRMVHTQRAEIGMLRAFGFGEGQILRHYISYGVVTALLGTIPAIALGTFGGAAATTAYTSFLSIPFSSRQLSPTTWLMALTFGLVLGAIAGYMPARVAARIEPAAAMRTLGAQATGKRTILERVLPPPHPPGLSSRFAISPGSGGEPHRPWSV